MVKDIFHGGNLAAATRRFGMPKDGWVDLSTGINPVAYPVGDIPAECWGRLPGGDEELCAAAALAYGAPGPELIVPAPGTQSLIMRLPELFRPAGSVAILAPTYAEHAAAWRAAGHQVREAHDPAECREARILVLVNPNNPTGRIFSPEAVLELAEGRELLVVDEAFADVTPESSVASRAGRGNLVVLRSFGKFFGLAGLRLGFAIAAPSLASRLRQRLGPWAVSGPALNIGAKALADGAWMQTTRRRLSGDRERLDSILRSAGLTVLGGTDLFRLTECGQAGEIYHRLGRAGILVRPFPEHPEWLRFGLPGSEAEWRRLENALL